MADDQVALRVDSSIGPAAGFDHLFAAALHEAVSILMKGIER